MHIADSRVPALMLPLPPQLEIERIGLARQRVHDHNTTFRFSEEDPARENRVGFAAEAAFATWAGLELPGWTGESGDEGYDFLAPGGRVSVKGSARRPWFMPVRTHHFERRTADFYVLAHVRTACVAIIGWTDHDVVRTRGRWHTLQTGESWIVETRFLSKDMGHLHRVLKGTR